MKILNLYAGIGGNRALWGDEDDITAVENVPDIADVYRKLWPNDTVVEADAHQYLLDHYKEFDFIWSSPPCPTHSRARYGLGFHGGKVEGVYPDMRLYQEIIFLKHHFKGSWVVENVQAYYKPLIHPYALGRHWYWANFHISKIKVAPSGITTSVTSAGNNVVRLNTKQLQSKLGIVLPAGTLKSRLLLRNAVEPEVGLHIFNCHNNLKQEVLL
jgi:DNA (cytosine-5)-methyltransferase 1